MTERDYVKYEAERQGLDLSEDDLEVVVSKLTKIKETLAQQRPTEIARLEPAYVFRPDPK